jgi:integrase/recombinase XerD
MLMAVGADAVKIDRNGKAAAVTPEQFEALLAVAAPRYRCLFTLQRATAARISEALALTWADVAAQQVTFRKANTKTKATRQVPQSQLLQAELVAWRLQWEQEYGQQPLPSEAVFPGAGSTTSPQTRQAADLALRKLCKQVGLEGVSLHSFRRTAAQDAVGRGVPLHVVQALTGHRSLGSLGEYLAATPDQILQAIG